MKLLWQLRPLDPAPAFASTANVMSGRACACLVLSLLATTAIGSTLSPASAQNAGLQSTGTPIFLRGTTGSGETEAVFEESIDAGEVVETDTAPRPITINERQVQGRARAVQPEAPVVDPLTLDTPSPRSNRAASPSQQGTGAVAQDDPFAPTGLRLGTWRVFSTLEQTLGYSTNTQGVADGKGGGFSQTRGSVSLRSDWSRHSANLDASGNFRHYIDSDAQDLPDANVTAGLNLDLIDGVTADGALRYDYSTESATSTNITSAAVNRPGVHAFGGSAGLTRNGGKLSFSMRGSVGRTIYEDIDLSGGGSQSQSDRNNNLYLATGRVGYEVSPALTPFIEVQGGRRIYDDKRDRNGDERNSTILGASVGTAIDLGEKLSGEASLGYRIENYDGNTLEDLEAVTLNGSIVWSPVRETTVTFNAATDFSGSTTAGQNGAVVSTFGVAAERQVTDRLSLNADAGLTITRQDDGSQTDTLATIGGGFNYWLNRFAALTGRVEHTRQTSTAGPAQEFDATSAQLGIRLQR